MKYYLVPVLALCALSQSFAAITIDDFSTGNFTHTSATPSYVSQSGVTAAGPLRYSHHNQTSNPLNRNYISQVSGGKYSISTGTATSGNVRLIWGGGLSSGTPASGSGSLLPGAGITAIAPPLDLSGESKFRIVVQNSDQATGTLRVMVWNSTFTQFNQSSVVAVGTGSSTIDIDFSDVFSSVSSNSIGAIGLQLDLPTSNDMVIDSITAVVPEPASMLALGAGLAALAARRRRK